MATAYVTEMVTEQAGEKINAHFSEPMAHFGTAMIVIAIIIYRITCPKHDAFSGSRSSPVLSNADRNWVILLAVLFVCCAAGFAVAAAKFIQL